MPQRIVLPSGRVFIQYDYKTDPGYWRNVKIPGKRRSSWPWILFIVGAVVFLALAKLLIGAILLGLFCSAHSGVSRITKQNRTGR